MKFKAPNRLLARIVSSKRQCGNCEHFDLEEGQQARAKSGIFAQVTEVVPPSRVSGSIKEGEEYVPPEKPMPRNMKWEHFGMCMQEEREGTLIWAGDTCPSWG